MDLDRLPASMIVLGGGYVAMEQAQLFAFLGTRVTMLVRSQLARREEPEVAAGIRDAFVAEGIDVVEGVQLSASDERTATSSSSWPTGASFALSGCSSPPAGAHAPRGSAWMPSVSSWAREARS